MPSKVQEADPILWIQSNLVSLCQMLDDSYVMDYLKSNGEIGSVRADSLLDCIRKANLED